MRRRTVREWREPHWRPHEQAFGLRLADVAEAAPFEPTRRALPDAIQDLGRRPTAQLAEIGRHQAGTWPMVRLEAASSRYTRTHAS